ncbi:MAG: hypothetical protein CNCCGFBP_02588 [Fimbriimonadaceae bacterium]|nr:hypothetical protein [Fimbriimonadaceae bacterium]
MIGRGFALLGVLVGLTTLGSAGYYELRPLDPPTFPKNPYGGTLTLRRELLGVRDSSERIWG